MIGLLKATFTHVVLDLSKGYTAIDLMAMEMANTVLLVTQFDLPCLRNVVRLMTSLGEMNGLADKVKIIVNRVGLESGQITLKKAEETIGREIFWQLPNDYRTMIDARNNGVPLIEQAPKAAITHSMIALAAALSGDPSPAAPTPPPRRPPSDASSASGRGNGPVVGLRGWTGNVEPDDGERRKSRLPCEKRAGDWHRGPPHLGVGHLI